MNRRLCAELTPHSLDLIEAFGLSEELLAAPIASGNIYLENDLKDNCYMSKTRIRMGNVLFASRCVERDATIIIFVAKKVEIFENR